LGRDVNEEILIYIDIASLKAALRHFKIWGLLTHFNSSFGQEVQAVLAVVTMKLTKKINVYNVLVGAIHIIDLGVTHTHYIYFMLLNDTRRNLL